MPRWGKHALVVAWFVLISSTLSTGLANDGVALQVPADYPTLQAAIDAAREGDRVAAARGLYSGEGNTNLDFRGKAIALQCAVAGGACTIDCAGSADSRSRGFYFHNGEGPESTVEGFTIFDGYADRHGGAVLCVGSSPTFRNCTFSENRAEGPTRPNLFGITSYWSLDDAETSTAMDFSGPNDGLIAGAQTAPGRVQSALFFDGLTSKVSVPHHASLNAAEQLTVAAWINGSYLPGGTHTIASKGRVYYLGIKYGHLYGQVRMPTTPIIDRPVMGSTRLDDNQWHHVAMVYDAREGGVPADLGTYTGLRPDRRNPLIPRGAAGEWDEWIREIGNILYDPEEPDPSRRYKHFYTGYAGTYAGNNVLVGFAYSPDAIHWTKTGPIHSRALEDPYVVKHEGVYYLFAEDKADVPFRNIRRLRSTDCVTWIDDGDTFDRLAGAYPLNWEALDVSSPVVWIEDGTWYML